MKALLAISCFFLLFTGIAFADGPPMNKAGNVYVDHVVIILKDQQVGEVGRTRKLTFDKEQLAYLRKMDKKFPKAIAVITPHYDYCTCGLPIYGIWNRIDRVAIPLYAIGMIDYQEVEETPQVKYSRRLEDGGVITVDAKGDMYFMNKPVRRDEVKEAIDKIANWKGKRRKYLCFNLPPKISDAVDGKIKKLVDEIKSYAGGLNMNICIVG
jgi:hypothetical protein